jgi:hypothetical protein
MHFSMVSPLMSNRLAVHPTTSSGAANCRISFSISLNGPDELTHAAVLGALKMNVSVVPGTSEQSIVLMVPCLATQSSRLNSSFSTSLCSRQLVDPFTATVTPDPRPVSQYKSGANPVVTVLVPVVLILDVALTEPVLLPVLLPDELADTEAVELAVELADRVSVLEAVLLGELVALRV